MRAGRSLLLSLSLACGFARGNTAIAQSRRPSTAPAPPSATAGTLLLSPQAAYQDALHPLEVTRHNIANWSDVELAAMNVAIAKAKAGCQARKAEMYTGADLVELARLCSLGQEWGSVVSAASRYIAEPGDPKPLLPDAYVAQTEAKLRLKDDPGALASALTMLKAVPYSGDVGDCVDEVLGYLRYVDTANALTVAQARQPLLLEALRTRTATPVAPATTPPLPETATVHGLYAQGLLLPALQQLAARPADARASVAALDAALPAKLSGDDTLYITQQRHRYGLLGQPLRGIKPITSLSSPPNLLPDLPAHGAVTALLLFPDWCAQCVKLVPQLPSTVFTVEGHSAYAYGLLAETVPARKPDPTLTNVAFNPAYAAAMLAETPTVTVPPEMLQRFDANDFPLLLLTDTAGVLRVMQVLGAQDLQPGGDLDAAVALVAKTFSPH